MGVLPYKTNRNYISREPYRAKKEKWLYCLIYDTAFLFEKGDIMTRQTGRPADETGRLAKEIRTYDFLDANHVWYERIDHEAAMTMEVCEEIDKALEATICKNLFLCNRQETNFYLLMLPGHKKFKTKDISKQLGVARLSFAKDAYMEEYLDITPGSVSVLGLMNDTENHVQLLMDKDLVQDEYVGCHPCINTSSLRLKMDDLLHVLLPAMHHEPIFVTVEDEEITEND